MGIVGGGAGPDICNVNVKHTPHNEKASHQPVPVNVKARLIFYKPGFITKSVDVDTRNALNTKDAQKANQKVDFDVILEANDIHRGLEYAGPVGAITFLNGSGLMKVKHDRKMIPVETMAALAGE